jgi:deoxyribodipyrimidine photo-lyase
MDDLTKLSQDPRVTRRRPQSPDPGGACVWYWIERAQRGIDNPALDVVVDAANALRKRVVVFSRARSLLPNANLHHYHLLAEGGQIRYMAGESMGWKVRQQELH